MATLGNLHEVVNFLMGGFSSCRFTFTKFLLSFFQFKRKYFLDPKNQNYVNLQEIRSEEGKGDVCRLGMH